MTPFEKLKKLLFGEDRLPDGRDSRLQRALVGVNCAIFAYCLVLAIYRGQAGLSAIFAVLGVLALGRLARGRS